MLNPTQRHDGQNILNRITHMVSSSLFGEMYDRFICITSLNEFNSLIILYNVQDQTSVKFIMEDKDKFTHAFFTRILHVLHIDRGNNTMFIIFTKNKKKKRTTARFMFCFETPELVQHMLHISDSDFSHHVQDVIQTLKKAKTETAQHLVQKKQTQQKDTSQSQKPTHKTKQTIPQQFQIHTAGAGGGKGQASNQVKRIQLKKILHLPLSNQDINLLNSVAPSRKGPWGGQGVYETAIYTPNTSLPNSKRIFPISNKKNMNTSSTYHTNTHFFFFKYYLKTRYFFRYVSTEIVCIFL